MHGTVVVWSMHVPDRAVAHLSRFVRDVEWKVYTCWEYAHTCATSYID